MFENTVPWIVLLAIVVASLAWKGYIKLPSAPKAPLPATNPRPLDVAKDVIQVGVDVTRLTSHELGLLMAQAARREAELEVAGQVAKDAAAKLKATFTAPFSPAEPAPAAPSNPGV